jgi:hypothetical protein
VEFQDVDVAALDRTGSGLITGNHAFSDLRLVPKLLYVSERLASKGSFGFQTAQACDCTFDWSHEYVDAVAEIRVLKNEESLSEDISHLFGIDDSFDVQAFVDADFIVPTTGERQHWLDLVPLDDALLTGTMTLTVEIELASGAVLNATTEEITFI